MVLERNIDRYLKIVAHLFYDENSIKTLIDLSKFLNVTCKTAKQDIDQINNILSYNFINLDLKKNTFHIDFKGNFSLKQIQRKILNISTKMAYFYYVSMSNPTLEDIYLNLGISESLEYRIRQSWNKHFSSKKYDTEFSYNKLSKKIDLIGDEKTIRTLMRYMIYEYCYEDITRKNEVIDLLNQFESYKIEAILSRSIIDYWVTAIFVSISRIVQGFKCIERKSIFNKMLYNNLEGNSLINNYFRNNLKLEFTYDLLIDIFDGNAENLLIALRKKRRSLSKKIFDFFQQYSYMKFKCDNNLADRELNLLERLFFFSDCNITGFVLDQYDLYWNYNASPADIAIFEKLLEKYSLEKYFEHKEKKQEFYYYINLFLIPKTLCQEILKKKFLIITRLPENYVKSICDFLINRFDNFMEIEIYQGKLSAIDDEILYNYDYIISEFSQKNFKDKHIILPEVMSNCLFYTFERYIFDVLMDTSQQQKIVL